MLRGEARLVAAIATRQVRQAVPIWGALIGHGEKLSGSVSIGGARRGVIPLLIWPNWNQRLAS